MIQPHDIIECFQQSHQLSEHFHAKQGNRFARCICKGIPGTDPACPVTAHHQRGNGRTWSTRQTRRADKHAAPPPINEYGEPEW